MNNNSYEVKCTLRLYGDWSRYQLCLPEVEIVIRFRGSRPIGWCTNSSLFPSETFGSGEELRVFSNFEGDGDDELLTTGTVTDSTEEVLEN